MDSDLLNSRPGHCILDPQIPSGEKKKRTERKKKKTLSVVSCLNKMLHFALWFTWHEFSSLICEMILRSYSLYCNPIASSMFIQKICLTFLSFLFSFSNKWKGKLVMCIYNNGILTGLEFLVLHPCLLQILLMAYSLEEKL